MRTAVSGFSLGLGVLLSLVGGSAAADPECRPTAVIEGQPEVSGAVISQLSQRGVSDAPALGCPAIRAEVEATATGIEVSLRDPSGKVGTFYVVEPGTAAALIEAWARAALEPLLPLGGPDLLGSASLPAAPQVAPLQAPPQVFPLLASPQAAYPQATQLEDVAPQRRTALQASASILATGPFSGPGVSLALVRQRGQLQFSVEGDVYKLNGRLEEFITSDSATYERWAWGIGEVTTGGFPNHSLLGNQDLEGLVRVGAPFSGRLLTIVPSIALGVGVVHTTRQDVSGTNINVGPSPDLSISDSEAWIVAPRVEAQVQFITRLSRHLSLVLSTSLGVAPTPAFQRDPAFGEYWGGNFVHPYIKPGVGLSYR